MLQYIQNKIEAYRNKKKLTKLRNSLNTTIRLYAEHKSEGKDLTIITQMVKDAKYRYTSFKSTLKLSNK